MKAIEFRGHSDDTFGYDVFPNGNLPRSGGDDHDDCANGKVRTFLVHSKSADAGLHVIGVYNKIPTGVWAIGIAQLDEDVELPTWMMHWSTEGYTPVLRLHVPDDATITLVLVDGKPPDKDDE